MALTDLHQKASKFAIDNSPMILTAFGVAGTITTAVLAGKASYRAALLIDDALHYEPDATAKQRALLVWKLYIPAISVGATTIGCIICANRIGTKRAAAMAAAYSISERAFDEYRGKIVEKLGENKERSARDEIAQDRVNLTKSEDRQVIVTGNGDVIFMDAHSGRFFSSTMEAVRKAENEINYQLIHESYASLNDFYDKIGLARVAPGEEVGWSSDRLLEIQTSTTVTDDEKPCFVINFSVTPVRDYFRTH